MSDIENPQNRQKDSSVRDDEGFMSHHDVFNAISSIQLAGTLLRSRPETTVAELGRILNPVPIFEAYFRERGPKQGYASRTVNYNPAIIAAFDVLARKFNADRQRIIEVRDLQALTRYEDEFRKIVYGT